MIKSSPISIIHLTLCITECQNQLLNTSRYDLMNSSEGNMSMINGILMGVGFFIGIVSLLTLIIWCFKPRRLENTKTVFEIIHPEQDEAKIWSSNFTMEEIQKGVTPNQLESIHNIEYATSSSRNNSAVDADDHCSLDREEHSSHDNSVGTTIQH
uniref:PIR Superfamily Protein n=1 Tax=Trichobilharzia regenti TaxID=157069 RepID=A0AA85KDB7_TRIRE|nr:unnamed protein product [Trichobilharzia regenti]